jgi:hypothetical protein
MTEESSKELLPSSSQRVECYITLLEIILRRPKKYKISAITRELSKSWIKQTFSTPENFQKLVKSFNKILHRKTGRFYLFPEERKALVEWHGLKDGNAYCLMGNSEKSNYEKLGDVLGVTSTRASKLVNRAVNKLRKQENLKLLPEEAQNLFSR